MSGVTRAEARPVARCVLWHGAGTSVPRDLTEALDSRGVNATLTTSSFLALAEVCRLAGVNGSAEPSPSAERASEGAGRFPVILLFVEPALLAGAGEIARAVERYAPAAKLWQYEADAPRRLRAVADDDIERWFGPFPELLPRSHLPRVGDPLLRLVRPSVPEQSGEGAAAASAAAAFGAAPPSLPTRPGEALTPDELTVLLSDRRLVDPPAPSAL